MVRTVDAASRARRPARVQAYIDALVQNTAQSQLTLVSVVLFGSAAEGGFSAEVSDVDVIIVVGDDVSRAQCLQLSEDVARLETVHELRSATPPAPGGVRARFDRMMGHGFSCFVCTRSALLSGDVARVLDLRTWEAFFVDRIVFASIMTSAITVWGEDLVPRVEVPPVRRLDVFKALFGFSNQALLSAVAFAVLPDATKYAMDTLKHSVHSCFFCYHRRTATLEEEVAFFNARWRVSRALAELVSLRREYRPSLTFVLRCVPTLARLHLRTARDNRFSRAA
jgi:predicted nucleotidyltransferase